MKSIAMVGAVLVLAACSTTVSERAPLTLDRAAGVTVEVIEGQAAEGVPADLAPKLRTALRMALARRTAGAQHVSLRFTIDAYRQVGQGTRMLVGAFGGADRMKVTTTVMDQAGAQIGQFEVDRKANPGGYGMMLDQQSGLLKSVAGAIADELDKPKVGRAR